MNCKPEDVAYVVNCEPYNGRVVTVKRFVGEVPRALIKGPHWHVEASWSIETGTGARNDFWWPDALLRPISGIPVNDEVIEDIKEPA